MFNARLEHLLGNMCGSCDFFLFFLVGFGSGIIGGPHRHNALIVRAHRTMMRHYTTIHIRNNNVAANNQICAGRSCLCVCVCVLVCRVALFTRKTSTTPI